MRSRAVFYHKRPQRRQKPISIHCTAWTQPITKKLGRSYKARSINDLELTKDRQKKC
jgi:hypothetical protein